ncbi:MAG: PIN domain-containing protein [Acidobacteria bacterium]|nr:MAG: PIN domain-containing protein [Acidobacteriota bacterium]
MLVVDASAVVDVVAEMPPGEDVRERLDNDGELAAPHLIDLEVLQALRRFARSGDLSPDRAQIAIEDFEDLSLTRYPHVALLDRIWALRDRLSAYDAAYVALAEAIGVPLVTCDAKLASAAAGIAAVELFSPID